MAGRYHLNQLRAIILSKLRPARNKVKYLNRKFKYKMGRIFDTDASSTAFLSKNSQVIDSMGERVHDVPSKDFLDAKRVHEIGTSRFRRVARYGIDQPLKAARFVGRHPYGALIGGTLALGGGVHLATGPARRRAHKRFVQRHRVAIAHRAKSLLKDWKR